MCTNFFPDPRWISHAALDFNEDGMIFAREYIGYELQKFNFSVGFKSLKHLKFDLPWSFHVKWIETFKPDIFLLIGSEDNKCKMYSYDFKNENAEPLEISGDSPPFTDRYSYHVHKSGNSIFVICRTEQCLQIYSLDLQSMIWHKLMDLPWSNKGHCPRLVEHDNKFFLFEMAGKEQSSVFLCDKSSQKILDMQTKPCPSNGFPGIERFRLAKHGNSVYMFSGTFNLDIWRFDFPTLTWSLLPVKLPDLMLQVNSDITTDGQMYIVGYDKEHYRIRKINLARRPRPLQKLCWSMILNHPRSQPLTSHSNDELHNFGIPKRFRLKLNW